VGPHVPDAQTLTLIVADMRLPRALLALAAGAGLAISGVIFQGILRNPLADSFTLGVSGGAAFGAALAISLGATGAFMGFALPLAAFAGATAALGAVLLIGRIGGGLKSETLVLAGVVTSAFLAALIALVKALDEASVTGIVFWIMGSFQGRGWTETAILTPGLGIGCAVAFALRRELDMLSLGDSQAGRLGLSAARVRLILLLAAGWITASCVAVSGIVGFVGLIVPHLCRLLLGAGHGRILPTAALCGALLLLWSDTAARTILPGGVELPVGVITALLGGPFFCCILGKRMGRYAAGPVFAAQAPPRPEAATARASAAARRGPPSAVFFPRGGSRAHTDAPVHASCNNLRFSHNPRAGNASTLSDISLTLRQGEFVGLLGPNGSGKSTLLDCICGMLAPQSGKVLVMGRDIRALPEKQRALLCAVLPQRPELPPAFSVFSLVLSGRYARTPFWGGYSRGDELAVWRALEECGVSRLADRTADSLSGGELQRALLARALVQDTPLLLLDEAAAGLDPGFQTAIFDALARRNAWQGLTVLAALHDLNLAALYCRRLIFLKQGRIIADGPTDEVFVPDRLRLLYGSPIATVPHPDLQRPQALLTPGLRGCGEA
jgi:iron complex transport system permease protein